MHHPTHTRILPLLFLFSLSVLCASASNYTVYLKRVNKETPILNGKLGQSTFDYNYNCAYLPLFNNKTGAIQDALLVRCQNATVNQYTTGPSELAYSILSDPIDYDNIQFTKITDDSVVFEPESSADNYGTEDPRIVYRDLDQTYYLLYSAVQQTGSSVISRLALATTQTPLNKTSWVRHGPLFPNIHWSKSGAMLIRDDVPGSQHYLFWGDSNSQPGLTIATSTNLLNWTNLPGIFLPERKNNFDSALVEAGPMPLRLTDGNYLMIYNSARGGFPSPKPGYSLQYNVGWAILDGNDPTKVIQRCEEPLLSPVLAYELGVSPFPGLTPNVVFLQGWKRMEEDPNSFLAFYGAADSTVGVAGIVVDISSE